MRPPRLIATTLLALIWLGGALAVLQVVLSAGVPSEGAASLIAHVSGMAAGYGAAIMLILMSRSPWLERGVGTHRLARWHGWGGQLVIILTVVHALLAVRLGRRPSSTGRMAATEDVLEPSGAQHRLDRHGDPCARRRCLAAGGCDDASRTNDGTSCTC